MKIKELIKQDPGFLYVVDSLELMSAAGRRFLLDTIFCTDPDALESEWERLSRTLGAIVDENHTRALTDLRHCLMQLHDLQGTLLSLGSHSTLNEVELFELKNLALLSTKARVAIAHLELEEVLPLPDLDDVFALLDPDHTGIANFYIYDSYHPRLAPLRRELKALQEHGGDPLAIATLLAEQNELQTSICTSLCDRLYPRHTAIAEALEGMAYADVLLAKATMSQRWGLVRPRLADSLAYRALFNPRLRFRNEELGLRYQPVDVELRQGVTLITGANMAGKTVLLKSIGTAQTMAQCGMFVPATEAQVTLVSSVATSIGDEQNEMSGLSSYAAEIIKISDIVKRTRSERMLVLIDEPARTTNPVEGKALVQAIVELLEQSQSISLVTTHYGQLGSNCRKLRVRGFVEDMADVPLTPQNISHFIDYSLAEDNSTDVPHEALRIAAILGCDERLIAAAQTAVER